jgi:hypothetical protein
MKLFNLTIETASFRSDSPNTTIYSVSFTRISTNVANTAIGSTAVMNEAKRRHSNNVNGVPPYIGVFPNAHKVNPIHIVLKSLLSTANKSIVPKLSKNARFGRK